MRQRSRNGVPVRRAQFFRLRQARYELVKWLAYIPHAWFLRIDIREYAKNARATRRTGRKRVYVEQIIALVHWQVASTLFQRTKAGKIQLEFSRIRRKQ